MAQFTIRVFSVLLAFVVVTTRLWPPVSARCALLRLRSGMLGENTQVRPVNLEGGQYCEEGRIVWSAPANQQQITFYYNSQRSFTLCLTMGNPGSHVYRLLGRSKRLLGNSSVSGHVGCLESTCGSVSLLFVADAVALGSSKGVIFTYESKQDLRCPRCTESCQKKCVCSGEYVFIGKVTTIKYNPPETVGGATQLGHYLNFLKVGLLIKYGGVYVRELQLIDTEDDSCQNGRKYNNSTSALQKIAEGTLIPQKGVVVVYSKCGLKVDRTYLISSYPYTWYTGKEEKERLVLCCADDDPRYAQSYLEGLMENRGCCS